MPGLTTTLVGIINLTPDSFSDGGNFSTTDAAVEYALQLTEEGAGVLDIGAESTRPGATPLSWQEEWARLEPFLKRLSGRSRQCLLSLDTRHAESARRALDHGMDWINDVSGVSTPAMAAFLASIPQKLVLMHSLSIPAERARTLPETTDPVQAILAWAKKKIAALEQNGIAHDRLIFDPGIGFGKTAEQSLTLLKRIAHFKELGVPIMVGHSRKSFLSLFTHAPAENRDAATAVVSYYLAKKGIEYLRVHNVKGNLAAMRLAEALEK